MICPARDTIKKATPAARRRLLSGWQKNNAASFSDTLQLVHDTGALTETRRRAALHAEQAAESLQPCAAGDIRQTLITLAQASVKRRS